MTALRCTQKLLTAMKLKPSAPPPSGRNVLGDWSLNLLHVRPVKLVLAMSEHDRFALVLEAAPYATLPQRFADALFVQLLFIGVPPDVARRECDAAADDHGHYALPKSPEHSGEHDGLRFACWIYAGRAWHDDCRNKRPPGQTSCRDQWRISTSA